MARASAQLVMAVDPAGNLTLDGLVQEPLGSQAKHVGENVFALGHWQGRQLGRRAIHGGEDLPLHNLWFIPVVDPNLERMFQFVIVTCAFTNTIA